MKLHQVCAAATLLLMSAIASILLTKSLFSLVSESSLPVSAAVTGKMFNEYTYEGDDVPPALQIPSDPQIQMVVEESVHYSVANPEAMDEWIYTSPYGAGSYPMGPNNRTLFVTMFHHIHCLRLIRSELLSGGSHEHSQHCLNYLRELVLCKADTTLEPGDFTKRNFTLDREGETHTCRDWRAIYAQVNANWLHRLQFLKESNFSVEASLSTIRAHSHVSKSEGVD